MKKFKMFIFGLDQAGKTSLISSIKENQPIKDTKPTLSMAVSKYFVENVDFLIYDAPGQEKFRNTWKQGYIGADLLFFVLDTTINNRFAEAKAEFDRVFKETPGKNIVFCYHKSDLPNYDAKLKEAKKTFNLSEIKKRKVVAFETSIFKPKSLKTLKKVMEEIAMGIYF